MSFRIKTAPVFLVVFLLLAGSPGAKEKKAEEEPPPAEYPTQNVNEILVAPFSYTMSYQTKGSAFIPKAIIKLIESEGLFAIVGDREPEGLHLDQTLSTSKLARMGRRAGADAVISGAIQAFQRNDNLTAGEENHAEVSFCIDWIDVRRSKVAVHHCYTATGRQAVKKKGSFEKMSHEDRMVAGTAVAAIKKFIKDLN